MIERFVSDSLNSGKVITFFNWECPPRFLENGQINYLVDLDKIFRGQKIDKFTEIPRVVEQQNKEIRILKYLNKLKLNYRFVKIVADTNADYLTPESIDMYGRDNVANSFNDFKNRIKTKLGGYPAPVEIYFFTELMSDYVELYKKSFNQAYGLLKSGRNLVLKQALQQQIERTREHIGIEDPIQAKEFSIRTIATYAAEGVVFDMLSQTKNFSNCIWLNIEEVNDRTIQITNYLRNRRNIGPLPMLFL